MSSGVPYSSVAIELSTDGGANFNMVAPYESDDGSYAWEVPYTPTTRGRIKVNSISFNTEDASDADFTIGSASVAEDEEQQRELFALECSPTHFARHPFIRYSLEQECDVALRVYNPAGRVVTTLVCGRQRPGRYSVRWDVGNAPTAKLPAGTYFCRLEAGDYTATRKMVKTD
jgi:hypothetical protein